MKIITETILKQIAMEQCSQELFEIQVLRAFQPYSHLFPGESYRVVIEDGMSRGWIKLVPGDESSVDVPCYAITIPGGVAQKPAVEKAAAATATTSPLPLKLGELFFLIDLFDLDDSNDGPLDVEITNDQIGTLVEEGWIQDLSQEELDAEARQALETTAKRKVWEKLLEHPCDWEGILAAVFEVEKTLGLPKESTPSIAPYSGRYVLTQKGKDYLKSIE